LKIDVFPPQSNSKPFFRSELTAFGYLPAIPFSTNISKYVGIDLRLAQPPLPSAESTISSDTDHTDVPLSAGQEELCGTQVWRIIAPEVWGKAKCCWVKYAPDESKARQVAIESTPLLEEVDSNSSWWPAYKPWKVGLWIQYGKIDFKDGHEDGLETSPSS
jgi:hypothetical protein